MSMSSQQAEQVKEQTELLPADPGREKRVFCLILGISFVLILVLNLLTPLLSDDYAYLTEVREAGSVLDLFAQEYHQYLTWNGRSVAHLILRLFLYLPLPVFRIANSCAFVAVAVLMTRLIGTKKRYDCLTLLLVELMLWLCTVDFSQTILWMDGACNYLWGSMIILVFMLMEKKAYEGTLPAAGSGRGTLFMAVLLLALGVIAGWCNENTSGGCLLFVLALLIGGLRKGKGLQLPVLTGAIGNLIGLLLMVLSPGEQLRASYDTDENYSGLLGLLSRFQKITLNVRTYFGILLAVLLVCWVIMALQKNRKGWEQSLLYAFLFAATTYALILSRPTQPRALFGAGLFLVIALITAIRSVVDYEREHPKESGTGIVLRAVVYGGCAALVLLLLFEYADNGTNLARVYRDEQTRTAYIEEQAAAGVQEIIVPLVHTDFYNAYSAIEDFEMTEDPAFWINVQYEEYYGVTSISAIDYDEWEDLREAGSIP